MKRLIVALTWILQVPLTNRLIDRMGTSHVSPTCLCPRLEANERVYIALMVYCLWSKQSPIFLTCAVMEVSSVPRDHLLEES
jgi:hypothetical protein